MRTACFVLVLAVAACDGASDRTEPDGGAVDSGRDPDAGLPTPRVIASWEFPARSYSIAVEGDTLYIGMTDAADAIVSMSTAGGAITSLVPDGPGIGAGRLLVDGDSLVFSSAFGVWIAPRAGDTATPLFEVGPTDVAQGVTVGTGGIYFGNYFPDDREASAVRRVDRTGANLTTFWSASSGALGLASDFGGLAVDGDRVYWTVRDADAGKLVRAPLDGGTPTVTPAANPGAIVLDGDFVYWSTQVPGSTPAGQDWPNSMLLRAPRDGSAAPTPLATTPASAGQLVVEGGFAYWLGNGQIWRVSIAGGEPQQIAVFVDGDIAVNHEAIFWTNRTTGDVLRLDLDLL
jgi:hypothetical protein